MTGWLNPALSLLPILLVATWIDLKNHRIPNWLSFGTMILGFILSSVLAGWPGFLHSLSGLGVGFGLFIPLYLLRGMGGGDVKLMAAIGVFLGPSQTLGAVAATQIIGGLMGVGYLIKHKGLQSLLWRYWTLLKKLLGFSQIPKPIISPTEPSRQKFPYAMAILLGTGITLWRNGNIMAAMALFSG